MMLQKGINIVESGFASDAPSKGAAVPVALVDNKKTMRREKLKHFICGFVAGAFTLAVTFGIAYSSGTASALFGLFLPGNGDEPRVTDAFISGKLESASEMTSAKYFYSGIKDYEEGFIPVINRSKFSMYYTATVRAGIENIEEIKRQVTDDKVILTLPAAKILDVHVHPDSLRYFDKEDPLIHPDDREQVARLLSLAEEDVKTADMGELLDLADEQLEKIMRSIFEGSIGEYELVIKHKTRASSTAENAVVDADDGGQ